MAGRFEALGTELEIVEVESEVERRGELAAARGDEDAVMSIVTESRPGNVVPNAGRLGLVGEDSGIGTEREVSGNIVPGKNDSVEDCLADVLVPGDSALPVEAPAEDMVVPG